MPRRRRKAKRKVARVRKDTPFKSGFEERVFQELRRLGVKAEYEPHKLPYTLEKNYVPDVLLPNGIYVELKGEFDADARAKMAAVKRQHPDKDIRLVFLRASNKLRKGAKMTYGEWADRNGYQWAEGGIPIIWIEE